MKTTEELAASMPYGSDSHKKQSTHLKRITGGIRSTLASSESTGLRPEEKEVLSKAVELLSLLADRHARAAKIVDRLFKERLVREKTVLAEMAKNFGAINTVEERVAFVGAVQSYALKPGIIDKRRDLDYYYTESIGLLASTLAQRISADRGPRELVEDAWRKFQESSVLLVGRHQATIDRVRLHD